MKIRLGLIGAGNMGRLHYSNIRNLSTATLVGVADVDEIPELGCGSRTRTYFTRDPSELLDDEEIDAVLICTPINTHSTLVSQALEAKKHVFCEKPLGMTAKEARAAYRAEHAASKIVQVGFNQRFDEEINQLAQKSHAGQIGDIRTIRITSRDPAPPCPNYLRTAGGIFVDMMIHDFDMANYLTGGSVISVSAFGKVYGDLSLSSRADVDTAVVVLEYSNDVLVVCECSRYCPYGFHHQIEVVGSTGRLSVGNECELRSSILSEEAEQATMAAASPLDRFDISYYRELEHFIESILCRRKPEVSAIDGLRATELACMASASLEAGKPIKRR